MSVRICGHEVGAPTPAPDVAAITNITIASNILTVTANNDFAIGATPLLNGLTHATFLNGQVVTVLTSSSTQFTAAFTHANYPSGSGGSGADTGTATITFQPPTLGDGYLQVTLIQQAPASCSDNSPTFTIQLPLTDNCVTVGSPTETWGWGINFNPALLNNPLFGVDIQAFAPDGQQTTFDIYSVTATAWLTPGPPQRFHYVKSYEQTDGDLNTLALDASGTIYQEDVVNAPGVLTPVYTAILPGTYAKSCTLDDREFWANSNLLNGTDIPYSYNALNFDRLSQVGPGAPPSCSTSSTGSAILTISQNPAVPIPVNSHSWVVWAASSSATPQTPGNVFTIVPNSAFAVPSYIQVGSNVVLAGFATMNGFNPNSGAVNGSVTNPAFYTVTALGAPVAGQQSFDWISVILPRTGFYNAQTNGGATVQATVASVQTAGQVPNLQVGNQFAISGTGGAPPSGYDGTWQVLATPNASQLQITGTSLTGNVASYSFNVITGSAPVAGEFITVTGTLNGQGIFNVNNAVISSVSGGSFFIGINSPNIPAVSEDGSGIIFGTEFTFDAFAIIGDRSGGQIVTNGLIGIGVRKACVSFLTRNSYITKPSPVFIFNVVSGANGIACTQIPTGPSNVIGRIVSFTGANGGRFFNLPLPTTVINNGVTTTETSTWINDNTTTQATFSFSDNTLLAGAPVDVQGNNLFADVELGSCLAVVPYAERLFVVGEQTKVPNFLNWSFDGGVGTVNTSAGAGGGTGTTSTYPLGWTVDTVNGVGGSVVNSPIFGNSYYINNNSGSTQAVWGMIEQSAFLDENQVPIIAANTTYSVRVTARTPSGATQGNLVIDLYRPDTMTTLGSFTQSLSGMTTNSNIFSGTLLTVPFVPSAGAPQPPPPPPGPPPPPTFNAQLVQHFAAGIAHQLGNGDVLAATYPNPVTAGNSLVLVMTCFDYNVLPIVTDSHGNVWQIAFHQQNSGSEFHTFIYYASGVVGGFTTVTVTESHPRINNQFINATFGEFNGLLTPVAVDGSGGILGTTNNSGTVTTSNAHDVIIVGKSQLTASQIPTGYSLIDSIAQGPGVAAGTQIFTSAFKVVTTAGTFTPAWQATVNSVGVIAAFKLAPIGGATVAPKPSAVPVSLLLRVYGTNLPNGADIELDRLEVFPTEAPVFSTRLRASYVDNFEAFDNVTGFLGVGSQNQQAAVGAFHNL